jgi:MoaA/NifB/PqqE/SkfB family radical SAM enzyme
MPIVFIPTWRCNNACSYCDYKYDNPTKTCGCFSNTIPADELSVEEWLSFFNNKSFNPPEIKQHLELTGGEPLIYEDLIYLLRKLPHQFTYAITTNATLDAFRSLPLNNLTCITASYHFSREDRFIANIKYAKIHRFKVRVTIVVTPENISVVRNKVSEFNKMGFGVNIHFLLKEGFEWDISLYNKILAWHNSPKIFVVKEIGPKYEIGDRYQHCSLGNHAYAVLGPNGSIYRCYSELVNNISYSDITHGYLKGNLRECHLYCNFPCDQQAYKRSLIN